jgi:dipeptidase E
MRLVLLSNSTNFGTGYLEHAADPIRELFRDLRRVLFVPFALHDQEAYWQRAHKRFAELGIELDRLREGPEAPHVVREARGIFVGGGNTFRLLDRLHRSGLVKVIRGRARAGVPYLGASAGTVIASPTIRTTNDMPIVQPHSFESLDLVPFQINCHYLDPDPASRHMGETRDQRLREYLEENSPPVLSLREGALLHVVDDGAMRVTLSGSAGARLFRRGSDPVEVAPGASLDYLAPV